MLSRISIRVLTWVCFGLPGTIGQADIYRWDNGELIPGTENVSASPNADLSGRDLAYANFRRIDLTDADLSNSNLRRAHFGATQLTGVNFTDARLSGTYLNAVDGLTAEQLYSTASYKVKDLSEIVWWGTNLVRWDFTGQDLRNATFYQANLTDTVFTDARIEGANIGETTGLTPDQIYSTASYLRKDLQAIGFGTQSTFAAWDFSEQNLSFARFSRVDLSGATFAAANLSHADLSYAVLTDADFSDATLQGADLSDVTRRGFLAEQLYSTRSHSDRQLTAIDLGGNDLSGWNMSQQDLTNSLLTGADLTGTNFADAIIANVSFRASNVTSEQIESTGSYQQKSLKGVNMSRISLSGWDFRDQNLANSVFGFTETDCCVESPDINNVDFTGASLNNAWIQDFGSRASDFSTVNFSGADFSSADLSTANFLSEVVFDSGTIYNQWTLFPHEFDPVANGWTFAKTPDGDFDGDGILTIDDLDLLMANSGLDDANVRYDVNGDSRVDDDDVFVWVRDLKETSFGDANLDNSFDSNDLVQVLQSGEYEDWGFWNSTWESGDWNGDLEFTSADLVVALAGGGYEQGLRPATATVPEPPSVTLLLIGLLGFVRRWR